MLAPAGLLETASVAISGARWVTTNDLLPETTSTVRVSVEWPALLTVTECWPAFNPDRVKGVTQEGSVFPSICTCAPWGVESIAICPGTITGAAGATGFFLAFLPLAAAATA